MPKRAPWLGLGSTSRTWVHGSGSAPWLGCASMTRLRLHGSAAPSQLRLLLHGYLGCGCGSMPRLRPGCATWTWTAQPGLRDLDLDCATWTPRPGSELRSLDSATWTCTAQPGLRDLDCATWAWSARPGLRDLDCGLWLRLHGSPRASWLGTSSMVRRTWLRCRSPHHSTVLAVR